MKVSLVPPPMQISMLVASHNVTKYCTTEYNEHALIGCSACLRWVLKHQLGFDEGSVRFETAKLRLGPV
jgi:hypothetical protein